MSENYLFLDIDGVLNGHSWNEEAQSNTIDKECVWCFNQIIRAVQPKVVISSAWRYMINGYAISLKGFEYLLRTHGVSEKLNIVDTTQSDEDEPRGRPRQILNYIHENKIGDAKIVILDDEDYGWNIRDFDFNINPKDYWYQTDPYYGLRRSDIKPILEMFK